MVLTGSTLATLATAPKPVGLLPSENYIEVFEGATKNIIAASKTVDIFIPSIKTPFGQLVVIQALVIINSEAMVLRSLTPPTEYQTSHEVALERLKICEKAINRVKSAERVSNTMLQEVAISCNLSTIDVPANSSAG
jgi:hypothetical protein